MSEKVELSKQVVFEVNEVFTSTCYNKDKK